ncbi:hypothetical protein [Echinicola sp. 20G]|uniref:hypothetical protein n=1 Tax=Echinicola sp. 20G TaxID=2781961 RepID=UPI00191115AD|nr:hypothetical protein [Echinicola sp. 20G]
MRKLIFPILILSICLSSCKEDDIKPEADLIGVWQLSEIYHSEDGHISEGSLGLSDEYTFRVDGTFERKLVADDEDLEGSGTYSFREAELINSSMNKLYLVLTFQSGGEQGWVCGENKTELQLTFQDELVNSCEATEGRIYYYKKQ